MVTPRINCIERYYKKEILMSLNPSPDKAVLDEVLILRN